MSEYDNMPNPSSGIAFCFYCGTRTRISHDGKWMCEDHYDEKVKSKYRLMHNQQIEKVET